MMASQSPDSSEKDSRERFRRLMSSEEDEQRPSPEVPEEVDFSDQNLQFVSLADRIRSRAERPHAGAEAEEKKTAEAGTPENPAPAEQAAEALPSDTHPVHLKPETRPLPPLESTPATLPPEADTPLPISPDMPLPRRVSEVDVDATRVTPSAYTPNPPPLSAAPPRRAARPRSTAQYPPLRRPRPSGPGLRPITRPTSSLPLSLAPPRPVERLKDVNWRQGLGCLLRMFILALFVSIVLLVLVGSFILYQYYQIAATLPSVEDLRQRSAQFETTRILDRSGNLLYEIMDPAEGRRTYVKLDKISPNLVAAVIATEDKEYYRHPGFDPAAILRAFWQNYRGGETVSGASTITQQLVRMYLIPEEQYERTYLRKVREALLAAEVTRRYSKDEILELYLNDIYFGNLAYGIEAAAETYFGTTADKLTLGQAAFLAGLPQAPSIYDVYTNREITLARQEQVLRLMLEASQAQNCIYVSNSPQPVCVDINAALAAFNEIQAYNFQAPQVRMRYPHWVNYVRTLLEELYDPQTIYRSGFRVYTTLDPALQDAAEEIVREQVESLANRHVTDGALVAIRPSTGEILAMVGSADYYNEAISGQVNMAISPRQPGSAIKPITYLAAFEKGWTPATLIWDVPSEFPPSGDPQDTREPYRPVNYDGRFHGPVTVRSALANSYNVPAVKTLQFVGIYDNPSIAGEDGLIAMARRLGITTLTRNDYGLALTLGGGDVSLLEFTGVYATLANNGLRVPPYSIQRIEDHEGNLVYEYQASPGQQVLRPEHAFLITSILSDNEARTPMFGADSVLNLSFQAAAKTGTTNNFIDNWTMGYNPDLAVGVWVGNADYTPMENTSGLTGAAPIWAEFMELAVDKLTGGSPSPFFRPAGVINRVICEVSGTEPSEWCPRQRNEYFAADQPPLPKDQDLWSRAVVDTWTNLRASPACGNFTREVFALNVRDPWAIRWIQETDQGRAWADEMGFPDPVIFAPERECRADDPRPILQFTAPGEGQTITMATLEIYGRADATPASDFRLFRLDYGQGHDPIEWNRLVRSDEPLREAGEIYSWDLSEVESGPVTLRLRVNSTRDTYAELFLHLNLQVPTATPTPTPTTTPSPTPTPTLPPDSIPTITPTSLPDEPDTGSAPPQKTPAPPPAP